MQKMVIMGEEMSRQWIKEIAVRIKHSQGFCSFNTRGHNTRISER